jgi:hypothetical protein
MVAALARPSCPPPLGAAHHSAYCTRVRGFCPSTLIPLCSGGLSRQRIVNGKTWFSADRCRAALMSQSAVSGHFGAEVRHVDVLAIWIAQSGRSVRRDRSDAVNAVTIRRRRSRFDVRIKNGNSKSNSQQHVVPSRDGGWASVGPAHLEQAGCSRRSEMQSSTPEKLHPRKARSCTCIAVTAQSGTGTATAWFPCHPWPSPNTFRELPQERIRKLPVR